MHTVFAGVSETDAVCVVADDSDIFLSLLYVSSKVHSKLYFRQGKTKDKSGIEYHDIHSAANHLGPDICGILLPFHALTGSDFTHPFYGRTKVTSFKKLLKNKVYCMKLATLGTESVNIEEVIDFVLHIIYNRPLKEKTPGESRYKILLTAKKQAKGKKKKYPSSKVLPPDQSSLKMKILRATFIAHCLSNCLDSGYVPLNPSEYGWKWNSDLSMWELIWYEGSALPSYSDINNNSEEDHEDDEDDQLQAHFDEDEDSDCSDDDESDCVLSADNSEDETDEE